MDKYGETKHQIRIKPCLSLRGVSSRWRTTVIYSSRTTCDERVKSTIVLSVINALNSAMVERLVVAEINGELHG